MFDNPYVKTVLSALAISFFGFILLNLTFLFYALTTNLVLLLFSPDFAGTSSWFMPVMMTLNTLIIILISWFILKSKLGVIYKAIYSTVPLAVTFTAIAILLYRWTALSIGINALVFGAIIVYLYITKKPWPYYYAAILMASSLLIMTLLGVDI